MRGVCRRIVVNTHREQVAPDDRDRREHQADGEVLPNGDREAKHGNRTICTGTATPKPTTQAGVAGLRAGA